MRLIRIQSSARKTVIYHPSLADVVNRVACLVGKHQYEVVREYQSVGAKEEMCLYCLKERHTIDSSRITVSQTSGTL